MGKQGRQNVREDKAAAVDLLKEMIAGAESHIFSDFRGLDVGQMMELRSRLKEHDSTLKVVKNNFVRIAIKELGLPESIQMLVGPTAVTSTSADPGPVAKVLCEYGRDTSLAIKGGLIAGKEYTAENVESLSKLPSRDVLLALLLGAVQAPVRDLASVLSAVMQKLVRTLQAVADKKAE